MVTTVLIVLAAVILVASMAVFAVNFIRQVAEKKHDRRVRILKDRVSR